MKVKVSKEFQIHLDKIYQQQQNYVKIIVQFHLFKSKA